MERGLQPLHRFDLHQYSRWQRLDSFFWPFWFPNLVALIPKLEQNNSWSILESDFIRIYLLQSRDPYLKGYKPTFVIGTVTKSNGSSETKVLQPYFKQTVTSQLAPSTFHGTTSSPLIQGGILNPSTLGSSTPLNGIVMVNKVYFYSLYFLKFV